MSVVRAGAAAGVAAAALIALATPWKSPPAPPALGALVSRIDEPASIEAIGREAIELVPAIRPPTSADGLVRIVAYLRLPPGATLRAQLRDGVATLEVPRGTIASRVEAIADGDGDDPPRASWRVLDVRATRFGDADEQFRLLRPRRGGGLAGLAWPRSPEGSRQAAAAITTLFEQQIFAAADGEEASAAARLVRINDCASCHVANRSEDRRPAALVQKGTDQSGLFQVLAALSDQGPFERYRPRNPNEADVFMSPRCGDAEVPWSTRLCADGQRPRGHLDLARSLAAGTTHARRVCASRRALASRMDALGRRAFRAAFTACDAGFEP